jgi:hypothetical protein
MTSVRLLVTALILHRLIRRSVCGKTIFHQLSMATRSAIELAAT